MIDFTTYFTSAKERTYDADEVDGVIQDIYGILVEISQRRGAYSMDHLTHASNTINNMERLALEGIALLENRGLATTARNQE